MIRLWRYLHWSVLRECISRLDKEIQYQAKTFFAFFIQWDRQPFQEGDTSPGL